MKERRLSTLKQGPGTSMRFNREKNTLATNVPKVVSRAHASRQTPHPMDSTQKRARCLHRFTLFRGVLDGVGGTAVTLRSVLASCAALTAAPERLVPGSGATRVSARSASIVSLGGLKGVDELVVVAGAEDSRLVKEVGAATEGVR